MRTRREVLALIVLAASTAATAGGSFESVKIKSISITNAVEYELVVTPLKPPVRDGYVDPYMGKCSTFVVRGTYSRRAGFPFFVTRDAHLAALGHLSQAHAAGRTVNLGWMGTGFVPLKSDQPCVVRSRALHLHTERETTSVVSYHDAI